MDYTKRWDVIEEIGSGGQGKVYRVVDKQIFDVKGNIYPSIEKSIRILSASVMLPEDERLKSLDSFKKAIIDIIKMEDLSFHGALKVLHKPQEARDFTLAKDRIKREIEAMADNSHRSLLKILDVDKDSEWFVSKFYPNGTLDSNLDKFKGEPLKALKAFRPLVEGVAELHKRKIVHRDIKPHNVFLNSDGNLILGDFGLIFFNDNRHTRISHTLENVGSRDWMPAWAMGIRIDDIKPSFDVFSLGKLLWSMISGEPFLNLWYFERNRLNLEEKFPNDKSMRLVNMLLKKCVVEEEKNCLPDATVVLSEVDSFLSKIESDIDLLDPNIERICKVCAVGKYKLIVDRNPTGMRNFGIEPVGVHSMKIFRCNNCGNVQLFSFEGKDLKAWSK